MRRGPRAPLWQRAACMRVLLDTQGACRPEPRLLRLRTLINAGCILTHTTGDDSRGSCIPATRVLGQPRGARWGRGQSLLPRAAPAPAHTACPPAPCPPVSHRRLRKELPWCVARAAANLLRMQPASTAYSCTPGAGGHPHATACVCGRPKVSQLGFHAVSILSDVRRWQSVCACVDTVTPPTRRLHPNEECLCPPHLPMNPAEPQCVFLWLRRLRLGGWEDLGCGGGRAALPHAGCCMPCKHDDRPHVRAAALRTALQRPAM